MTAKAIKFIQAQLNARGLDAGPEDGVLGPRTIAALDRVEETPQGWSKKRKQVAFIQLLAREKGIEAGPIDGYWGPQTDYAFEALIQIVEENKEPEIWRPEDLSYANPNDWPKQTPQDNLVRFYGEAGKNQTKIDLPYPHRLSWNKATVIKSFQCHEKVHDSLHRVLSRVLDNYGPDEIARLHLDLWGGCLNVRKMRGGTQYSLHSWGIAIDYDPERNQLKWDRDRASFASPEYDTWWKLWEEEGWTSLGRTRNFDWMHVQAAGL
jgi:hypothetical protein